MPERLYNFRPGNGVRAVEHACSSGLPATCSRSGRSCVWLGLPSLSRAPTPANPQPLWVPCRSSHLASRRSMRRWWQHPPPSLSQIPARCGRWQHSWRTCRSGEAIVAAAPAALGADLQITCQHVRSAHISAKQAAACASLYFKPRSHMHISSAWCQLTHSSRPPTQPPPQLLIPATKTHPSCRYGALQSEMHRWRAALGGLAVLASGGSPPAEAQAELPGGGVARPTCPGKY